jgi:hypothetical protein
VGSSEPSAWSRKGQSWRQLAYEDDTTGAATGHVAGVMMSIRHEFFDARSSGWTAARHARGASEHLRLRAL